MKSVFATFRYAFLLPIFLLTLSLSACKSKSDQDSTVSRNQWHDQKRELLVNHGKVVIKLEPHGSIRAKIFQGQLPVYEFILDREKQQNLLTHDIDNADSYLTGTHWDGLVIDDLRSRKRYVLALYDSTDRLKDISTTQLEVVFVKGYAASLAPLTETFVFNPH